MEYNQSSTNAYTKPNTDYALLDNGYNTLIASPTQSLYPNMKFENVAFNNITLGYDALTKGVYTGSGYGDYNQAYPTACSQYNVVECPSNRVLYPLKAPSQDTKMASPIKTSSPPPTTSAEQLQQRWKALAVKLYTSQDSKKPCPWCQKAIELLQHYGLLAFTQIVNVQNDDTRVDLINHGGQGVPFFLSQATGKVYPKYSPNILEIIHILEGSSHRMMGSPKPSMGSPTPSGSPNPSQTDFVLFVNPQCAHCQTFTQLAQQHNVLQHLKRVSVTDPNLMKQYQHVTVTGTPQLVAINKTNGHVKGQMKGVPSVQEFKNKILNFFHSHR